jgi:hypothetical protein
MDGDERVVDLVAVVLVHRVEEADLRLALQVARRDERNDDRLAAVRLGAHGSLVVERVERVRRRLVRDR